MDESRPNDDGDSRSDDFNTAYESVYGTEIDPNVDYIRSTDKNGHYEQLWVGELGRPIKVPPRTLFIAEKAISSPNNRLRTMNDLLRDSLVREFIWRHKQEKDASNVVLASEIEIEIRELGLQSKLAFVERMLVDDATRRDGILRILSTPYSIEVEMMATEQIAALRNQDYVRECRRKLEDFCSGPRRR